MRIIAALLAFVALPAMAANLTWTNPTSYDDGSALVAADIASTTIQWSNTNPFSTVAGSQVVNGAATSAVAPDPAAGSSRCYRVYTTVIAAKGGQSSVPSNAACVSKPFPKPNPPTLLEAIIAWIKGIFSRFV